MKMNVLRNAVCVGLFAVFGYEGSPVAAQEADYGEGPSTGEKAQKGHQQPGTATTTELEKVTVTGTRIKGGTTPSPVITIGSERIQEEGFTDLGEVIRSVPQNFSGGQNPGVAAGATAGAGGLANQNVTGGSSLNLRGLGPDATLTLLNGRRLSYGGFVQAVDISAIPLDAVERVEIVPDGASALYGSDAVGGVGNVILKRDYEGAKVGWRYGGATDGGLTTREYTATAGTTWSSGGVIASFQDTSTDPIYARQRDYTRQMFDPSTLYPGGELRSGVLSLHQGFEDAVEFRLDALASRRDQLQYPWNTVGSSYYFRLTPRSEAQVVSPGLDIDLGGDWTLSVGGSWGRDETSEVQDLIYVGTPGAIPLIRECYCNRSVSAEVGAEGPVLRLPAGEARLAIGSGYRENTFSQRDRLAQTDVTRGEERNRFLYAELSLPVVSADQQVTGVHRLELTAAGRAERYSSFGGVTTPKLGVVYGPNADLTLKASWGKSFKAPTLLQRFQSKTASLDPESYYGGSGNGPDATILALYGGERDLQPERATTRALSLAVHPESLEGLEAELTWFDVDYTNRVVQPITDYRNAVGNPAYAQFIDYAPTSDAVQGVIDASAAFYNFTDHDYDPADVVAIVYGQYVNVARQKIHGLDLSASDRFDLGKGRLTVRGAATWLDSTQQNSAAASAYDIAGTLFNPARLNARAGAVWSQGAFSASTFGNYVSGVKDAVSGRKTASFTTFDMTLRYGLDRQAGALAGVEVALTAQNLLDRAPPYVEARSSEQPPYDSTNYSAIGRFVSVSVSKQW